MGCFGKVDGGIGGPVGGIEQVVEGRFEGGRKYDVDGVGKDGESVDNGRTWVQYGEIGVGDGSKVVECGGLRITCGEADQNFANGGIEERFDAGRCGMKGIGSVGLNVEGGNIRGQCGVVGGRNKSKVVDCEGIVAGCGEAERVENVAQQSKRGRGKGCAEAGSMETGQKGKRARLKGYGETGNVESAEQDAKHMTPEDCGEVRGVKIAAPKGKRGRPKGSKNKVKGCGEARSVKIAVQKGKRGRPKGSKNKMKIVDGEGIRCKGFENRIGVLDDGEVKSACDISGNEGKPDFAEEFEGRTGVGPLENVGRIEIGQLVGSENPEEKRNILEGDKNKELSGEAAVSNNGENEDHFIKEKAGETEGFEE
ncbi:hypothetical protein Ancab_009962 [Ancistrocladus abbreviatus]